MGAAKLIPQPNEISFETKKGELIIDKDEYLVIKEDKRDDKLMITKKGVQKIEDFFNIEIDCPIIDQQFVNNANFNIIVTIHAISEHGSAYGVASANRFNLTTSISCQFATEMAVKRARATAALEILRKNCIKTETLMLLYSSFDEFNAELQVNTPTPTDEQINKNQSNTNTPNNNAHNANNSGASVNNAKENKTTQNTSSSSSKEPAKPRTNKQFTIEEFKTPIITKKYLNGITIDEIYNTDKEYYKMMVDTPNPRRDFAIAYLASINKTSADL